MNRVTGISPWQSLIWLLIFVLVGAFVGGVLGILVAFAVDGSVVMQMIANPSSGMPSDVRALQIIQGFSSLGMFFMPPILLGYFERQKFKYFPGRMELDFKVLLLTFFGILSLQPLIYLSAMLNESMVLPDFLKGVEEWMRQQEESTNQMVKLLLGDTSWTSFILNLIVIAVIAAIGEEALFRGGFQKIFYKIFKNPHIAIWFVAVIFSAIHLQFYGFLPRMIMGAFFGYLFLWTGNIWYPILAHFINNAGAVVQSFWIQNTGGSLEEVNDYSTIPYYVYVIGGFIFVWIILQFIRIHRQPTIANGEELG